jgi:hypothetical protein
VKYGDLVTHMSGRTSIPETDGLCDCHTMLSDNLRNGSFALSVRRYRY